VRPSYGQTQKSAFVALVGEYSDGRKDEREIEVTSVRNSVAAFCYEIPGSSYIRNSGIAWTAPRA
jgi:hypothetical protein